MKLTLSFWSSCFAEWPKSQDKNWNILRKKRAFMVKLKEFFIIFKGISVAKICLRLDSVPLSNVAVISWSITLLKTDIIPGQHQEFWLYFRVQIRNLKNFQNIFARLLLGLAIIRGVFRTESKIFDKAYLRK